MVFKFGFSSSSAPQDDDSSEDEAPNDAPPSSAAPALAPAPAHYHTLSSLLPTLPQNISYRLLALSPSLTLPRRELYDIRMQLQSLPLSTPHPLLAALDSTDLQSNVYEGGLKSWECSLDLAVYLDGVTTLPSTVLELGCGSALPSLCWLLRRLKAGDREKRAKLLLADYNRDVLELVTLPNLLLTWACARGILSSDDEEGDFDVTPEIVARFSADLEAEGVEVGFVEGAWGVEFVKVVGESGFECVLASETIYEPKTVPAFVETLTRVTTERALVAAKGVYFGVGGSVEAFLGVLTGKGWKGDVLSEVGEGVRRVVLDVRKE